MRTHTHALHTTISSWIWTGDKEDEPCLETRDLDHMEHACALEKKLKPLFTGFCLTAVSIH